MAIPGAFQSIKVARNSNGQHSALPSRSPEATPSDVPCLLHCWAPPVSSLQPAVLSAVVTVNDGTTKLWLSTPAQDQTHLWETSRANRAGTLCRHTKWESLRQDPGSALPVTGTASAFPHALIGSPPFSQLPVSSLLSALFLTAWPSSHLEWFCTTHRIQCKPLSMAFQTLPKQTPNHLKLPLPLSLPPSSTQLHSVFPIHTSCLLASAVAVPLAQSSGSPWEAVWLPGGHLALCGEIYVMTGRCYWHQWIEARAAAAHSTVCESSRNKGLSSPTCQQPCPRVWFSTWKTSAHHLRSRTNPTGSPSSAALPPTPVTLHGEGVLSFP